MWNDLKHAVRSLVSSPLQSMVVLATLALAIGANTAIFSAVRGILLSPLPYDQPERLVMLWESNEQLGLSRVETSAATYLDWRERSETLDGIAAFRHLGNVLTGEGDPERISSVQVSPALFGVLGVDAALGRTFSAEEEAPGSERLIVLSHGAWSRRFGGDPGVLGRSIRLDGEGHTVIGVMPEGFSFPPGEDEVEIWSPLTLSMEELPSRPHRFYNAVGRVASGASFEQAQAEMDRIAQGIAEENPDSNEGWSVTLVPALEQLVGPMRSTLWLLFGAVGLVLLIGCVNIANLRLATAIRAQKDYAVRSAMGAGGAELVRRSLLESLLLALLGGGIGVLAAIGGIAGLRRLLPESVPRTGEMSLDPMVLAFTLGLAVLSGLLFGMAPALRALSPDLAGLLGEETRGSVEGRRARIFARFLVASEVALAVLLLVGAGLMIRSFLRVGEIEPGFRRDAVVSVAVSLPRSRYPEGDQQRELILELMRRVDQLPGVRTAGATSALPLSSVGVEFDMPFSYDGLESSSPSDRPTAKYRATTPGYLRAVGIPLLEGRDLEELDRGGNRNVTLINQTMAQRYFAENGPLGEMVDMPMLGEMEIVGVVGDVRHYGLESPVEPEVFVPFAQLPLNEMHVVVHTDRPPREMAGAIQREILALDPELPATEVTTTAQLLSDDVAQRRLNLGLLLSLALAAAVMAALGIYGVVSYFVARGQGEIGLRMALGAGRAEVVWMVVRETLLVVGAGLVAGLAASVAAGRLIRGLLFAVEPSDPATLGLVVLGVLALGVLASIVPAFKASRLDPARALHRS